MEKNQVYIGPWSARHWCRKTADINNQEIALALSLRNLKRPEFLCDGFGLSSTGVLLGNLDFPWDASD